MVAKEEHTSAELRAALGRVYLQAGQLDRAEAHFVAVAAAADVPESTKALNKAFLASARGEWDAAGVILRELFAEDDTNYAVSSWFFFWLTLGSGLIAPLTQAVNNLAVALLGQGKLKEGIEVLEAALETSPSTLAMAEPFLFNLCTCFIMIIAVVTA